MEYLQVFRYNSNEVGQDYIVGDLHGCYDELLNLLEVNNFDKAVDRLFSVGDLCDRGVKSLECLDLIGEPWFFSVIGNHEAMLINYLEKILDGENKESDKKNYYENGGAWVEKEIRFNSIISPRLFDIYLKLIALPVIITVGDGKDRFNITHAELAPSLMSVTDHDIDNNFNSLSEKSRDKLLNHAIWGRTLFKSYMDFKESTDLYTGLSVTYCGHSIVRKPFMADSHYFVDTGAFTKNGKLTMIKAHEVIASD